MEIFCLELRVFCFISKICSRLKTRCWEIISFKGKFDSVISFVHIHRFPWIILELREELKLEIVSRLLYSRYCIYVGLCRLCTAVRNSRLQISLSYCLWKFLTYISSKLHRERMRDNGEREG